MWLASERITKIASRRGRKPNPNGTNNNEISTFEHQHLPLFDVYPNNSITGFAVPSGMT